MASIDMYPVSLQQGYAGDFSLYILHFVSVRLTNQSQFNMILYYGIVLFHREKLSVLIMFCCIVVICYMSYLTGDCNAIKT